MRIGFINNITGTVMMVDESRTEEYKAAGFALAANDSDEKADKEQKKPTRGKKK